MLYTDKTLAKKGSFGEKFPELLKEWDFLKNDVDPFKVAVKSKYKANWICNYCKHEWQTRIDHRTYSKSGCPKCGIKKNTLNTQLTRLKLNGSLFDKNKDLLKEWHPTKNLPLTPKDVTLGSGKKVWWICKKKHVWQARVHARNEGARCSKCRPATSLIELRFFVELKSLFNDVEWRSRISGVEIDIYLYKEKIAIELDGYPWHLNTKDRDVRKNKKIKNFGIKLIRLRDIRLPKLSGNNISINTSNNAHNNKNTINKLLNSNKFQSLLKRNQILRINKYLKSKKFINNENFLKLQKELPKPQNEKSLVYNFPDILKDWDYKKNTVDPEYYTFNSLEVVWWICKKKHSWKSTIRERTKNKGCQKCEKRVASDEYNFKLLNPEKAKYFHPKKNKKIANQYTPNSSALVWWLCPKKHEFKMGIKHFVRITKGSYPKRGYRCPECSGRKVNDTNNFKKKFPLLAKYWDHKKNLEGPENYSKSSSYIAAFKCFKCKYSWERSLNSYNRRKIKEPCLKCRK